MLRWVRSLATTASGEPAHQGRQPYTEPASAVQRSYGTNVARMLRGSIAVARAVKCECMSRRAVALPPSLSSADLAPAALACPVLRTARTLAEWVGTGREVTARGVLRPAAAVEACDLLGIVPRTRKPRSALDIHELMMVWAAASAAGFIEITGGRAIAGPVLKVWAGGDPDAVLAIWTGCALVSLGLAGETGEMDEADLDHLAVLVTLHERDGVASLGDLSAGIAELLDDVPSACTCPDCAPQFAGGVFGLLGDVGADETEAEDAVQALGEFGIAVLRGDVAELTPLGHWLTDVMFRQSAPPADADAAALVGALADFPPMVAALMARPWLSARTACAAVGELLAAGNTGSGQERLTALVLARECGEEAAPVWREWAAKDGFGAYARMWLAEQDDAEPAEADAAWVTVDTLVGMLDALPPEAPVELLPVVLLKQMGGEIGELLRLLDGSGHPEAPRLVELLGGDPMIQARTLPETGASPRALRLVPDGAETAGSAPSDREGRAGAAYRIKVQLRGVTKPPVWRSLHVPADLSLDRLHEVIQAAMGWEGYHMHVFSDGRCDYGLPDPELGHRDERKARLSQLLIHVGDTIGYTYDFGDGWEHDIVLEEILPAGAETSGPVCVAGKGACPPEDCGGPWGYEGLKATLADPDADEHEEMLDWLGLGSGDDFDPKEFSVEEANRRLPRPA